jgi:hypothetical protein
MRVKPILFAVMSGWFVLSIGALGYVVLTPEGPVVLLSLRPNSPQLAKERSNVIANPPDLLPERDPAGAAMDPELAALLYRYFPRPLSQHYEEVCIRDYFQDRKGGFLLDVGASHYKVRSTTHYLDVALGWRGIAVDAIAELGPDYVKHRPRTKFSVSSSATSPTTTSTSS